MEPDKHTKMIELYTRAKNGDIIQEYELSFIPNEFDRNFFYKDLLSTTKIAKLERNEDITEIDNILSGKLERERKIKELELELLKLRGEDNGKS